MDATTVLYHVTAADCLDSIRAEGVNGPSYWTSDGDLADYYAGTVADEGREPVVLEALLSSFDESLLEPDGPSIAEPIMSCVRSLHGWSRSEGEGRVVEEWARTGGTWRDCLGLVGSVRYRGVLSPARVVFPPAPGVPGP